METTSGKCARAVVNTPTFDALSGLITPIDLGQFMDQLKPLPESDGRRMLIDLRLMREYAEGSNDDSGDSEGGEGPSPMTQLYRSVTSSISDLLGEIEGGTNVFDWNLLQVEENTDMP